MSYWKRFFIPISTRWIRFGGLGAQIVMMKIYVFGIKVADIQTSNPEVKE